MSKRCPKHLTSKHVFRWGDLLLHTEQKRQIHIFILIFLRRKVPGQTGARTRDIMEVTWSYPATVSRRNISMALRKIAWKILTASVNLSLMWSFTKCYVSSPTHQSYSCLGMTWFDINLKENGCDVDKPLKVVFKMGKVTPGRNWYLNHLKSKSYIFLIWVSKWRRPNMERRTRKKTHGTFQAFVVYV
jgi:hypothetical protein